MAGILENVAAHMHLFQQTYPEDAQIALFDTEKLVADLPGTTIRLGAKVGDPLSKFEGSVTVKALRERRMIREERDSSIFGIPYIATSVPIFDSSQLVGALTVIISTKKMEAMKSGAFNLARIVEDLTGTAEEVGKASEDLVSRIQEISGQSEIMKNNVRKSSSILKSVQKIADNSRLLGLNASIEAARIGELGRGFAVVADEIKKMAENSKGLVEEIYSHMKQISDAVETMHDSIQQVAAFSEENAASLHELHLACTKIVHTAEELKKASNV